MPYKEAIVLNVSNDGWAEVITDRMDACVDCLSARSCHSSCKSVRMTTPVRNDAAAAAGDKVSIYIRSGSVLQNAAILYLIPVAFLMAGALTGAVLSPALKMDESVSALLFAFLGIGVGFALIRFFSKRISNQSRRLPRIDRIVARAAADTATAKIDSDPCVTPKCR
jgi:sigma-E factor negative regulatory protein RseC